MIHVQAGHDRPVVCLDAGHSGKYNQSPAAAEFWESEFNWRFCLLLKKALEAYGMEVRSTRADPKMDPGLVERGKASRGCDLFLSIHANAADRESADYPLVIAQLDGKGDALAASLGKTIRNSMDTTEPEQIWHKANGTGADWYGVLRGAAAVGTVGLILEHGFYTNGRCVRWLLEEENLRRLAGAEAAVIAQWFGLTDSGSDYSLTLQRIARGCRGEKTAALQALLVGRGYSCGVHGIDGSFGPDTERAVLAFQTDNAVEPDGIVEAETMARLLGYR